MIAPLRDATSRSDLVADAIRAAILSGDLKPGELLVERQLAEQLGVSKTPVREALILLASTGLVTASRNKGVTVRHLALGEVRQIFEERLLLEPWALGSAIRAQQGLDLTEAAHLVHEARMLEDKDQSSMLAMTNRRFHRVLYSKCANPFIVGALDDLQDLTSLAIVGVLWEHWPTWRAEGDEHDEILKAANAGEAAEAEGLMRAHIRHSLARLGDGAVVG